MNIFFIGDIFGKAGRKILEKHLPQLIKNKKSDLVIANVENVAHGRGTRQKDVDFLKNLGVHVFTGGNHTFDTKDAETLCKDEKFFLRPANYPKDVPGKGVCVCKNVLVINLMGRVFMPEGLDSPFQAVDTILAEHKGHKFDAIFVDFHAETTSEKNALFHYLNGKISAQVGTHSHVQTADERISKLGTAYISDVGMTGPEDSIIGMDIENVLKKFLTGMPQSFHPAEKSPILCAVHIEVENMKAQKIERIFIRD